MKAKQDNMTLLDTPLKYVNENHYKEACNAMNHILQHPSNCKTFGELEWQIVGDIYLTMGKFKEASDAYSISNGCGEVLALILDGNIEDARLKLKATPQSPAMMWCCFLADIFSKSLFVKQWPSFLQIRHFLEITVYYSLVAKKQDYINIIFSKLNQLVQINHDAEKFIGYAYFHFGDSKKALELLMNSVRRNQYDGEIYFVLAQVYKSLGDDFTALAMLENAALFLPDHYPSKMMKKELLHKIKKTKI